MLFRSTAFLASALASAMLTLGSIAAVAADPAVNCRARSSPVDARSQPVRAAGAEQAENRTLLRPDPTVHTDYKMRVIRLAERDYRMPVVRPRIHSHMPVLTPDGT